MEIWLKGSSRFRFPVLPAEFTVTSEQGDETVNISALGEVDLGGKRKLRQVSFSSFFPKKYDPGYCEYHSGSPKSCVEKVERIKRGSPPKIIITGTPVNFRCRVVSFEWGEEDGTGDIAFTITLKEHVNISIPGSKVITLTEATGGGAAAPPNETRTAPDTATQSYTVKAGDCLSAIAKRLTGSSDWHAIYEANKGTIGGNPNLIRPGQTLTIPGAKK